MHASAARLQSNSNTILRQEETKSNVIQHQLSLPPPEVLSDAGIPTAQTNALHQLESSQTSTPLSQVPLQWPDSDDFSEVDLDEDEDYDEEDLSGEEDAYAQGHDDAMGDDAVAPPVFSREATMSEDPMLRSSALGHLRMGHSQRVPLGRTRLLGPSSITPTTTSASSSSAPSTFRESGLGPHPLPAQVPLGLQQPRSMRPSLPTMLGPLVSSQLLRSFNLGLGTRTTELDESDSMSFQRWLHAYLTDSETKAPPPAEAET